LWSDDERIEFIAWIADHPDAGDVIPGADGARKVRWSLPRMGKRGGALIVYFNLAADGTVLLVTIYAKSDRATIRRKDIEKAI